MFAENVGDIKTKFFPHPFQSVCWAGRRGQNVSSKGTSRDTLVRGDVTIRNL